MFTSSGDWARSLWRSFQRPSSLLVKLVDKWLQLLPRKYSSLYRWMPHIFTVATKKILQPLPMDASHLCEEESKLLDCRMQQIKSEIVTIGHIHHPYVVRLLAHMPKPECHYLVYEFMTNGSLHNILRSEAREKLRWSNRLKIEQQVVTGLEYLHMVHLPRIIHRDLKTANILLDNSLNARIADFGQAKMIPKAISGAISSENVAGTLGYIAPEYYQIMSFTDKSDIYSFGIILAVLVTRMFPTYGFFQATDDMCLVAWARKMVSSDDPGVAVDRTLLKTGFEEMMVVLKIACFCTYDDSNERPNSKEVHHMLPQIRH